ncbi:hypothetical protein [Methylomonas albis]|nr:hypothetical protein [Methylomonas albis]
MSKIFFKIDDLYERYKKPKRTIYRWMKVDECPFPAQKIRQKGTTCLCDPEDVVWEESTI